VNPSANQSPAKPDGRGVRRVEFRALGTTCVIQFRMDNEKTSLRFLADALGWVEKFEEKFSRFHTASLVTKINNAAGKDPVIIDAEMNEMLDLADTLYRLTDGILDPTMLPLLKLWDWKTVHTSLPDQSVIDKTRALTGWNMVERHKDTVYLPIEGMGLDFGGFGKEYAVDQVVAIARRYGIVDALIDFGRDIYGMGGNGMHPFWHVGLEDGLNPGTCWGGIAIKDFALCTSGDYARRFEHRGIRYGHILDPRTGWPVANGMRAASVCAPSCLQAGIYSTTLFVLGRSAGLAFANCAPGVDASAQDDKGIEQTPGFVRRQVRAA
jgi:thiamine biosynthesis lipoprotein